MKNERRSKGFVFIAALGVMAVGLLVVFAVSGAIHFNLRATHSNVGATQEEIMARSAADYAMCLIAAGKMATDGKPVAFRIANDYLRREIISGTIEATQAQPNHVLYRSPSLAHRAGDVLIHVRSQQMIDRYGRGERYLLCNRRGLRRRPIDVTGLLARGAAR